MNSIEYLKDPHLVSHVQRYFGVLPKNRNEPFRTSNGAAIKPGSDDDDQLQTSSSDSEEKEYVVTNKFWYFLFVLGTELGDEIFYASFIPFWFWNIDGAVGRRVVMVWSIIMCIGKFFKHVFDPV